jgi:hypothetical protein
MSYVPPYRANAYTYISEQLATTGTMQGEKLQESPDLTAPPQQPPAQSRSASLPSPATDAKPSAPVVGSMAINPLSIPPPSRKETTTPDTSAPPPPAPSAVAAESAGPAVASSSPPSSSHSPHPAPKVPPVVAYVRPPSPQVPSTLPTAAPPPAAMAAPAPTQPPLSQQPPSASAPATAYHAYAASATVVPSPPAALYTARIPELRVILARGRLSGVKEFSPVATGEDIYRAFCPGGDSYASDGANPSTAAAAAAANTTPGPVAHAPQTLSEMATALATDEGSAEASTRSSGDGGGGGAAATRGRLPPGWERRTFHNSTFYLDHISREAHEQEPWVVWWGRAGNADTNGV